VTPWVCRWAVAVSRSIPHRLPTNRPYRLGGALHALPRLFRKAGIALVSTNAARTRSPKRSFRGHYGIGATRPELLVIMRLLAFWSLVSAVRGLERANHVSVRPLQEAKSCAIRSCAPITRKWLKKGILRGKVQRLGALWRARHGHSRHVSCAGTRLLGPGSPHSLGADRRSFSPSRGRPVSLASILLSLSKAPSHPARLDAKARGRLFLL